MVQFRALLSASLIAITYASPLSRRLSQITSDSTAKWEQACLAAGGADRCNTLSVKASGTLLAGGGICDQQNAADDMIDLAKDLDDDEDMIGLAQIFAQQPRNSPDKLQVPYCQLAPRNPELNGLFHCQFASSDLTRFSGDQTGNLPLGVEDVTPAGSCPAKTDGPVPDGVQLDTLVTESETE
ncbi:hypothetical protein BDN72DRAFT_898171 [Pluteus cervinus]|uniref:Uncharacterized protein n=1 Tax=Pluteus cervinus TaxID=181527 RepID=A0ACD3ARP6_9AGAR|nr:hypothetical protein BDN72DRAFT_898171 [Pluteus cervinus]